MLTAQKPQSSPRIRSSKSSGSRVTSRPFPSQWQSRSSHKKKTLPLFIQVLLFFQRSSAFVALSAIAFSLVMYGLHFRNQQAWNQNYEELQQLQRYERTVIGINEALKENMATATHADNQEWVPLTPEHNIYLEPAPVPSSQPAPAAAPESPTIANLERPIAY